MSALNRRVKHFDGACPAPPALAGLPLSTCLDRPRPPGRLTPVLLLDVFDGDDRCDLPQSDKRIFMVLFIRSRTRIRHDDRSKVEVVCAQCRRQHCDIRGHPGQEHAVRL